MAGSITVTSSELGGGYTKYFVAWVSTAGGAVSANSFDVRRGHLHQVKFVPDSAGTQPSDLYDLTLLDADNVDLLQGTGANLRNNAASFAVPFVGDGTLAADRPIFLEGGALTPTIANAGNAKGGTLVLIVGP